MMQLKRWFLGEFQNDTIMIMYVLNSHISDMCYRFGFTTYPGKASDILKYTKVRTISNRQCRSMMAKSSKANASRVFDSSICTLPVKADDKTGTCLGDSGGALVTSTGLLLGITSWGDILNIINIEKIE